MHENQSNHSLVQHLRSLQTPQGRSRTGLYLIEGVRHLARAVEERAPIQSLFLSPCDLSNPFGQKLARKLKKSGTPCTQLSPKLYRDLTLAAEPQGLGATVRQQWQSLSNVRPTKDGLWLALESIESAGNLGTMIRTAEAIGVNGIIVIYGNADPYEPKAVRASMGSLFSQCLIRCSATEFIAWARAFNISLIGSSPAGLLNCKALKYRRPAVLLIGSEKQGLSQHLLDASDFTVRIPMSGRADSINAAVATGILLYQLNNP